MRRGNTQSTTRRETIKADVYYWNKSRRTHPCLLGTGHVCLPLLSRSRNMPTWNASLYYMRCCYCDHASQALHHTHRPWGLKMPAKIRRSLGQPHNVALATSRVRQRGRPPTRSQTPGPRTIFSDSREKVLRRIASRMNDRRSWSVRPRSNERSKRDSSVHNNQAKKKPVAIWTVMSKRCSCRP